MGWGARIGGRESAKAHSKKKTLFLLCPTLPLDQAESCRGSWQAMRAGDAGRSGTLLDGSGVIGRTGCSLLGLCFRSEEDGDQFGLAAIMARPLSTDATRFFRISVCWCVMSFHYFTFFSSDLSCRYFFCPAFPFLLGPHLLRPVNHPL